MTASSCPLCDATAAALVETYTYETIWHALESQWGITISEGSRRANAPRSELRLLRCDGCGLDRFDPLATGTPAFYSELMAAMPYNARRWEFGVVADRVDAADDVVDLGCGDGAFLRSLGSRQARTVGLDHNPDAIEALHVDGIEGHAVGFEEFAAAHERRFDVVTAFHLLEHVDQPVGAVRAAARCLQPGGRLFVSVPNRSRSFRADIEPLDFPPHHVTRWSSSQLAVLADRAGLTVRGIEFEPPDLSQVRAVVRRDAILRLRRLPSGPRFLAARLWGKVAVGPRRYAAIGRGSGFPARGMYGHAMLAELERPTR